MVYGEHRNKIWWKIGWSCGSSANFLSKPEVPGKKEGPGSGGSGEGRKVRGPECPGWTGSSGGRDSAKNRDFGIVDLGGKTWGKPKSEGKKEEIGGKEGWGG